MRDKGLTARQEKFCAAYVKHGNASQAYRESGYSPHASDKSVNELASRLLTNVKIQSRLDELRKEAAGATALDLQTHLATLANLRELATKDGRYSAAVQAEIARGKVVGLYVERIAMSGGLEITEKTDLSLLSADELMVLHALMSKAVAAKQTLQ